MIPDLLKNNLLEGSALSVIKSMVDVENIWKKLKFDPKLPLKKKLSQIGNISQLSEIRGQQKLGKHYQYDERLVLVSRTTKHQNKTKDISKQGKQKDML